MKNKITYSFIISYIKIQLWSLLLIFAFSFSKAFGQQTQWAAQLGGQTANAASVDVHGNIFNTGSYIGSVDFDPGAGIVTLPFAAGGNNSYITKIDSAGNLIWARGISGSDVTSWGIGVDDFGNVYIAGLFYSTADFNPDTAVSFILTASTQPGQFPDIFLLKLDSAGNFVWAFQIGSITGAFESAGNLIVGNNNIYITGRYSGTCDFDPGAGIYNLTPSVSEEVYLAKYDTAGILSWAVSLPLSYYGEYESLAATYDKQGNIFVGSYGEIAKVDTSGVLLFKKSLNNNPITQQLYLYVKALSCDSAGNVFACGYFSDTADFDTDTLLTYYLYANSYINTFLCRLTNNLDFDWATSFPQYGTYLNHAYNSGYSVWTDNSSVFVAGTFTDTLNINLQSGTDFLYEYNADTVDNYRDAYIVKYTNTGNFIWGERFGGNGIDQSKAISGLSNTLYLAGDFCDTADFNNGPINQTLMFNGIGIFNVFVLKFNDAFSQIEKPESQSAYFVFPSPTSFEIHLSSKIVSDCSYFSILDMAGKKITSGKISDKKIGVDDFAPGLYILEIVSTAGIKNHIKFIVQ